MRLWLYPTLFFAATTFSKAQAPCSVQLPDSIVVCNGSKIRLVPRMTDFGIGPNLSWTGDPGLSCYNCFAPSISGLTTGTYTFVFTATNAAGMCTASDTVRVIVLDGQAPQYTLTFSIKEFCLGDTVRLGGPPLPNTTYSWSSNPPGFTSTAANPIALPTQHTAYYVTITSSSCPVPTVDSQQVFVQNYTINFFPTEDTLRLCRGQSVDIGAALPAHGWTCTWAPTEGLTITNNGRRAIARPERTTLYTLTAQYSPCVRQKRYYILVDSLPANLSLLPKDTTICFGDTVRLRTPPFNAADFPGISFRWTRLPATPLLSADTLPFLLARPTETTVYRRIVRAGLCADTATAVVNVVPPATMSITPQQSSLCPGDSVLLRLSYTPGVTNIRWQPTTGLSCTTCDSVWVRPTASTTYTVSGAFQGCPVSASATVLLRPLAPLLLPPSNLTVCPGDSVVLNGLFDPNASYTWTSTHPGFGTINAPAPVFQPTQTATYYIITNNGCTGRDSVRVAVRRAMLDVSNDTTICRGQSARLLALTDTPGSSFEWRRLPDGTVLSTAQSVLVSPDTTTTYVITLTYGGRCQLRDTVRVTIDGEGLNIQFPPDPRLCPGEPLTLNTAPPAPGVQYTWTATPPDPGLTLNAPAPTVSPNQNTVYTVTARDGLCNLTRSLIVTVFSATLRASADTTICAGDRVVLSATGVGPSGRYEWSTGATSALLSATVDTTTSFVVAFLYGDTCALRDTVRVTTVPAFTLNIASVPDTNRIDLGKSLQLFASVTPPQNLNGFTFTWQETIIDTKTLPFNTPNIEVRPASNDTASAAIRYTLRAVSPQGCVRVAEKTFRLLFPLVRFPNAFTPDGDGHNDFFEMTVLEGSAQVERMQIFSRWGNLIFDSTDPKARWDGTVNGQPAPSDVYLYRISWRRSDGVLMPSAVGDVTLLR
ncbi:MAG: gliding motility-associated C-terminal domain-containing protein [Saprospiraceae bacterium]|nr:gliding motility-associated C-terminal domain-containing protein [Saprospiraceae bacterium]MDW8230965.1 gliding motility-associated C-terminal domain-containing protein [Saprospiraceae bacterium]